MITESAIIHFIKSELFSDVLAKAVNDGMDTLKDAIKTADRNRKSETQNLQTQTYQVIIDALNQFTGCRYQGEDRLYDTAESLLKEFLRGNYHTGAVKVALKKIDSDITDVGCSDFLETLCHEICKDENSVLYREIDMRWKNQESENVRKWYEENRKNQETILEKQDSIIDKLDRRERDDAADYFEIPAENRAQVYKNRWDTPVFLNHFDDESENDPCNVKVLLKEIYPESLLPPYTRKEKDQIKRNLKDKLEEYIVTVDKKRMLLILGQAGIGKSTLITWIMANLAVGTEQVLVYQFASDLENVNWQSSHLLSEILRALKLDYRTLENKALILDGFDEIRVDGDRERVLNKLNQELQSRNALKKFSLLITCRENYIYDLQKVKCDYLTLQPWEDEQIETFCKGYWNKCGQAVAEEKIQKIQESKEIYGIPLILYMILALDVSIEKSSSVVDVYDQIFSLKGGGIYDRCYDTEHRTNEPKIKKYIHQVTQKISFWIFEHNDDKAFIYQKNFKEICDSVRQQAKEDLKNIESDTLIGSYFNIKHCEGQLADEVTFVHRSIYEYFVAVYFFESLANLQSKEEAAGKLGELLKYGHLSVQMLQFIQCKFDSMQEYHLPDLSKDIFNIMLRDGMTYHTDTTAKDDTVCRTDEAYKNIVEREMNIFTNIFEMVRLWNSSIGKVDDHIVSFLRLTNNNELDLERIKLVSADLRGISLKGADFSCAKLTDVNFKEADLRETDFDQTNLAGACFVEADLKDANFSCAILTGANFCNANISNAGFDSANLAGAFFINANFQHANAFYANLIKTDFRVANLTNARLCCAKLSEAVLENAILRGADLENAYLGNTDLNGANLIRADLRGANLREADFEGANLTKANLRGANLREANFERANLAKADLRGAKLGGKESEMPNFSVANLTGTVFDEGQVEVLHEKYDLSKSYVWCLVTGVIMSYPEYCKATKTEN